MKRALSTETRPTGAASRAFEPAAHDIYKRMARAVERQLREPAVHDIHKLTRRVP